MGVSKLEAAINKLDKYNCNTDSDSWDHQDWDELMADVGNKAYLDAINGKLFRKNSSGEVVMVEVKRK